MEPTGPDTALYSDAFFEDGRGSVVALVPIDGTIDAVSGDAHVRHVEAADVAVMVHEGPFSELDRTYGALGTEVAARGIGRTGPDPRALPVGWARRGLLADHTRHSDASRGAGTHLRRRRARS